MKIKQFSVGKTELGVLQVVKEKSDEEEVIGTVLYQRLAASADIVVNAIERLIQKGLIARNSKKLYLTDAGKLMLTLVK